MRLTRVAQASLFDNATKHELRSIKSTIGYIRSTS